MRTASQLQRSDCRVTAGKPAERSSLSLDRPTVATLLAVVNLRRIYRTLASTFVSVSRISITCLFLYSVLLRIQKVRQN